MQAAAIHSGYWFGLLSAILAVVPVVALTVISGRMGRRGVWLAIPWVLLVLLATPSLIGANLLVAKSQVGAAVWPLVIPGSVRVGASGAVLLFSLLLAAVGCRRSNL